RVGQPSRWRYQPVVVVVPTGQVGGEARLVRVPGRRAGHRDRLCGGPAEAEREIEGGTPQLPGQHDVPVRGTRPHRTQGVCGVQGGQSVGRRRGVPDAGTLQLGRVQREICRSRVVPVARLAHGGRVAHDGYAGRVDGTAVGSAVLRPAATIAVEVRVEVRV